MTPSDRRTTSQPWDDDRLGAAFVDRYDRPAPRELITSTLARVSETSRRPRWWPKFDRPSGSRLAGAVALIAVVSLVGVAVLPRLTQPTRTPGTSVGPSSIPSAAQNTPYQSFPASPAAEGFTFAPAPAGFPATVEGLPVRTVGDVVNPDRPRDLPDAPIAVAGWFSQLPLRPCPSVAPDCNQDTRILAGTDKRLVTYRTNGPSTEVAPDGPILNPAILPGGASPPPIVGNGAPQPAVFIVHTGDPRAYQRGNAPVGLDTFVLDQVAWLNGTVRGPTVWIAPDLKVVRSPEQVLAETSGGALVATGTWPISISAVLGRELGTLGVVASQSPASHVVFWVVRLVGRQPGGGPSDVAGYGYVLIVGDRAIETTWTSP